jgi:hypothetical protein
MLDRGYLSSCGYSYRQDGFLIRKVIVALTLLEEPFG